MRGEGQRRGAQLHDAHGVSGRAQLEVAFRPPLQQQQHEVEEQEESVGAYAAEGEAAGKLAVCSHSAQASGADGGARDTELDVAGGNSEGGGQYGEGSAQRVTYGYALCCTRGWTHV